MERALFLKMPFLTGYHNVSSFGEKIARILVFPLYGHYKFSHSTREEEFFYYLAPCFVCLSFCLKMKKHFINKATSRFVLLALLGFLVLQ